MSRSAIIDTAVARTSAAVPSAANKRMSAREFGRTFVKEFREDDIAGIAAEVAYHLTFAIPPFLTLIVMIAAALNRFTALPVEETLREFAVERAPPSIQDVLNIVIDNAIAQVGSDTVSVGLITTTAIAIWAGSNGVGALMKAFNRAYGITEGRPFVRKKIVAIGLTLLFAVLANTAIALLVFGPQIGRWLAGWIGLGSQFTMLWSILRYPVALLLLMILLAVLYNLAPNLKQPFHWLSIGSAVATLLWVGAVFAFRLYLQFIDPGSAYGAFSSLVVLLLFLYLTSIILLIGAETNAILQTRFDEDVIRFRAEHPDMLDSDRARADAATVADERGIDTHDDRAGRPATIVRLYRRIPEPVGLALAAVGVLAASIAGWWVGSRRGN